MSDERVERRLELVDRIESTDYVDLLALIRGMMEMNPRTVDAFRYTLQAMISKDITDEEMNAVLGKETT